MSSCEASSFQMHSKKIKKRKIKLGNIKKAAVNKNCPKFILGHCWMDNKLQILKDCCFDERSFLNQAFEQVQEWINSGERDSLNLTHLIKIFGQTQAKDEKLKKFYCRKAFYNFLSENILVTMMKNRRVAKVLSYMICLQKFTARLCHPQLVRKLQFK